MTQYGPRIGDEPMSSEEILRAMRLYARKGIRIMTVARQAGIHKGYLAKQLRDGRITPGVASRISWVIRAINDGAMVAVSRRPMGNGANAQEFVRHGDWRAHPEVASRVAKCTCGLYEHCPCGLVKVDAQRAPKCQSSHIAVAIENAVGNMTRLRQSRPALPAGASGRSGFRSR